MLVFVKIILILRKVSEDLFIIFSSIFPGISISEMDLYPVGSSSDLPSLGVN